MSKQAYIGIGKAFGLSVALTAVPAILLRLFLM